MEEDRSHIETSTRNVLLKELRDKIDRTLYEQKDTMQHMCLQLVSHLNQLERILHIGHTVVTISGLWKSV